MDEDTIKKNDNEELLNNAEGASGQVSPGPEATAPQAQPDEVDKSLQNNPSPSSSSASTATPTAAATSGAVAGGSADTADGGAAVRNVGDDVQFLFDQAQEALASAERSSADLASAGAARFEFKDLSGTPATDEKATIDLLRDVELDLKIELGRADMLLEDVLKLRKGSVVSLDKLAGDPVDVYVNGRLIARGEVLVLNDNFCVRVAELIAGDE